MFVQFDCPTCRKALKAPNDKIGSNVNDTCVPGTNFKHANQRMRDFEVCNARQLHIGSRCRHCIADAGITSHRDDGIIAKTYFPSLARPCRQLQSRSGRNNAGWLPQHCCEQTRDRNQYDGGDDQSFSCRPAGGKWRLFAPGCARVFRR